VIESIFSLAPGILDFDFATTKMKDNFNISRQRWKATT
jgi:hypothetical protein